MNSSSRIASGVEVNDIFMVSVGDKLPVGYPLQYGPLKQ